MDSEEEREGRSKCPESNSGPESGPAPEPGINLKPCIAEMLRTTVLPSRPTLLLDRIVIVTLPNKRSGQATAYRLFLSDGEKAIQGISPHGVAFSFSLTYCVQRFLTP